MTYMDRTLEFNNATESVRAKNAHVKAHKKSNIQQKSQFALVAAKIGQGIAETSDKLDKLTKLTKMKSTPFDDSSVEIGELTSIIKQDITDLNKQIATLKGIARPASNKQNNAHSETIVTLLNTKLASTTKDFKTVLQDRTEQIKSQQSLRNLFGGDSKPRIASRANSESVMYKNIDNLPDSPSKTGGEVVISMGTQQQQLVLRQQDDYTAQRASAVENIERTIGELSGIFQQLSTLLAEQGDTLERIDYDIEITGQNIDIGQSELIKYLHNISSNRWLIVKLFLILIVFAVIFIVFFV